MHFLNGCHGFPGIRRLNCGWAVIRPAFVFLVLFATLFLRAAGNSNAADFYVVPFNVDPPLVVDGDLADWANITNVFQINRKEQVTFGEQNWSGPDDQSGTVRLAWRDTGLFIAAEVKDDKVIQTLTGAGMWNGDHVSVLLDMIPGIEPDRSNFDKGQAHIGLNPGSLDLPIDGKPVAAEIVIWAPLNAPAEGGQIISRRTKDGYLIEAFVPWSRINTTGVTMYKDANFEIAFSDCDVLPPSQQTWMTLDEKPWHRVRGRLLPMVFGDGNGKAPAPVRSIAIKDTMKTPAGKPTALTFTAPDIPKDKDPLLFFSARFNRPKVGGYATRALAIDLNDQRIPGDRIANRPMSNMLMNGMQATFIAPDGAITVPYTPSGEAFDKHPQYALLDNVKGCEFEFNVAGLLKPGENNLKFANLVDPKYPGDMTITVEKVELRVKPRVSRERTFRPAPTGDLPVCKPKTAFPKVYSDLRSEDGRIEFTVNGERFAVTSSWTAPDGKRYTGSSPFYAHAREVVQHDEWIEVRDTYTNLTPANVPAIQTHECRVGPERVKDVWISGLRMPSGSGRMSDPEQPTVFLTTAKSGVGMMPLNDAFRVHGDQSAGDGAIEIRDAHFVLKAGGAYTAEWAIVPVAAPDAWDFINACRRLLDVNFPMRILSAFLDYRDPVKQWTDEQYRAFIERKSANVISDGLYCAKWKGRVPQGVAFNELIKDPKNVQFYRDAHDRIRKVFPDGSVTYAIYYHCFIDVMDENLERFKDCRRLDAAGNHISYSLEHYKLYDPTLENTFGKEIGKGIDIRLDQLGANAFYWDEYNQSRGAYTYASNVWDGCSGDIDTKTFQLKRLKSAVHLVCLPFLEYHMRRIAERGVPAFYNGAPMSRTLARIKFQAFTETGSISHCHKMLLYTPVALGDHLTERSQQDAYNVMLKALDWGCLYAWYSRLVFPTHKTLTEHMFPSTPIELHEGYLIAKERIITNRSGLFGWDDASDFKMYVYDREGKATDGREAKKITRDGKTYAEIRLPEGYSAAVVRGAP